MRIPRARRAALLIVLPALLAAAWLTAEAVSVKAEAKKAGEKDPLHELMEEMASTFRKVRRQVRKPDQNEASAAMLVKMQGIAFKAKSIVPKRIAKLPKDKQAKAAKAYRLRMIELLKLLLDAEKAVLEARNDDAYTAVKKMAVIQGECHQALGVEE